MFNVLFKLNLLMKINKFLSCFFCLILFSCNSEDNVRTYQLSKINVDEKVIEKNQKLEKSKDLIWITPKSWSKSEGSSMRLVSFSVPYSEGVGDLSVIRLGGAGGGLESNINRWRRQLGLSPFNIDEINQSIIKIEGNLGQYSMIEIKNEDDGLAFLCAILPLVDNTIFVKLSLSSIGIKDVKTDFINFCSSLDIPN